MRRLSADWRRWRCGWLARRWPARPAPPPSPTSRRCARSRLEHNGHMTPRASPWVLRFREADRCNRIPDGGVPPASQLPSAAGRAGWQQRVIAAKLSCCPQVLASLPLRLTATQLPALAELAPMLQAHVARDRAAAKDADSFAKAVAKAQLAAGAREPLDADALAALMEVCRACTIFGVPQPAMHSGAADLSSQCMLDAVGDSWSLNA